MRNQRGGVAIAVIIILIILASLAWAIMKFLNNNPETTEMVVPVQTVEKGTQVESQARDLQQKAQDQAPPE